MALENEQTAPNEVPLIPESEMKLPEERFGGEPPETPRNPFLLIMLVSLMIVLLGAVAVVVIWGQQLINLVMPPPAMEAPAALSAEAVAIQAIEAELGALVLPDINARLDEIEAAIAADLQPNAPAAE